MAFDEDDFLQLSGIQHFLFCKRQWALIHLEQQWQENLHTVDGDILHEHVHEEDSEERRGDLLKITGMQIHSCTLGASGACDLVEFRRCAEGISLRGREGLWQAYPVEYKRGKPKTSDADRLQLCAQAMCLEEMLLCQIAEGALYYAETRQREKISFTAELRQHATEAFAEIHAYRRRGYTPRVKTGTFCRACSLNGLCLPALMRKPSADAYLRTALAEDAP